MKVDDIMMYHFSLNHRFSTPPCLSPSHPSPPWKCHEPWVLSKPLTLPNTLMYLPSSQLITSPPSLKKILTEVKHNDVTNLHGSFHLIVLAIHTSTHMTLGCHTGWKYNKTLMTTTITPAYRILVEEIPSKVIHPNVSDLRGLPLFVVLANDVVANHQLTLT